MGSAFSRLVALSQLVAGAGLRGFSVLKAMGDLHAVFTSCATAASGHEKVTLEQFRAAVKAAGFDWFGLLDKLLPLILALLQALAA